MLFDPIMHRTIAETIHDRVRFVPPFPLVAYTGRNLYLISNTKKDARMANHLYQNDLPDGLDLGPMVAIDCETMGLRPHRDRLCLIQMSGGDGDCHLVQVAIGQTKAPNPDRHGLKTLLQEMCSVDISKHQQQSDWGAKKLTNAQLDYAASDVLYLHQLKEKFDAMLTREGRMETAQACFDFLPTRAKLDIAGWPDTDIFAHS